MKAKTHEATPSEFGWLLSSSETPPRIALCHVAARFMRLKRAAYLGN